MDASRIYFWVVPAVAAGEWMLEMADGGRASLVLQQSFQDVSGSLDGRALRDVSLSGRRMRFTVDLPAGARTFGDRRRRCDRRRPGGNGGIAGRVARAPGRLEQLDEHDHGRDAGDEAELGKPGETRSERNFIPYGTAPPSRTLHLRTG